MALTNPFLHLKRNAEENPRGIFSRSPDETLTNAEALVAVTKLAFELRRLGVRAGDNVALHLPDRLSILFTEALYHEGAVGTIIPRGASADGLFPIAWTFTTDPAGAAEGSRVVTVDARFLQKVEENPYGIRPSDAPLDVLRIVFSSGTTGRPHAIALGREMEQAMDAALETWFQTGPSMTLMDTGTAWGMGEFFLSVKGGQPYLCVGGAPAADIVRLAAEQGVRTLKGSPQQVAAVVDELDAQNRTLPDIQVVVVAGTVMPPDLAARARRATEGCTIVVNYGSTEAGAGTSRVYTSDDPFDAGHAGPGTRLEIVDDDDHVVPDGTEGRIRLRSFGMVHEYLGDPEASARAFRDGWFYPGDLGVIRPDGGLTLTGRESEVLNAGGVKIDPSRLDHAALAHPGVLDACSFEYDGAAGVRRIGLALVATEDADIPGVVAALSAEFGVASPALVAKLEAIPRTATGKPKRRELAEQFSGS